MAVNQDDPGAMLLQSPANATISVTLNHPHRSCP